MKTLLARILCSAAHAMWKREHNLGRYRSETDQHELNLAFHYACELRRWFPWLNCDFDLSKQATIRKKNDERKRPDIVFHVRGIHHLNFLVVEVKRKQNQGAASQDIKRIQGDWMAGRYKYIFGASVIMADNKPWFKIRCLQREDKNEAPASMSHANFGKPIVKPDFSRILDRAKITEINRTIAMVHKGRTNTNSFRHLLCSLYGLTPEQIKIVEGNNE